MRVEKIIVDNEIADQELVNLVLKRFPSAETHYVSNITQWFDLQEFTTESIGDNKKTLVLTQQKGAWLKPCPGTKNYLCCKYLVLNVVNNCHMDCSYCILQGYFNAPVLIAYVNIEELFEELTQKFRSLRGRVMRIGTGELTDSLTVDRIYNLSQKLIPFFRRFKDKFFEIKTKGVEIDHLLELDPGTNIFTSWSMNAQQVIEKEEHGAPTLAERINAAQMCQIRGYRIGLHFDPLIRFPEWRRGYSEALHEIFRKIDPDTIVWISMGCLRFPSHLKEIIKRRFPISKIIYEEFIKGRDGKLRYLQPVRIEMYSHLLSEMEKYVPREKVYLCMESPEVWEAVFGEKDMTSDRLSDRLDKCALGTIGNK